jgi:hypothetical protein
MVVTKVWKLTGQSRNGEEKESHVSVDSGVCAGDFRLAIRSTIYDINTRKAEKGNKLLLTQWPLRGAPTSLLLEDRT